MILNPSKCIFKVSSNKFLGYLVTKCGIEANPNQIQALLAISSPKNIHEVQQLTRWVATLNRFVSKSADKCLPFFKILRKNRAFEWTEESKMAPLFTVSSIGEELVLYLSISPTAAILIQEEDKV